MSSIDFDNEDFDDIIDQEDIVIIDTDEIDDDEKLEATGDIDDVDEDEFEIEIEDGDDGEDGDDIDIDVLDIEEKIEEVKINDDKFITVPFITKYEYPKIISTRAQQIASGSPIFINIDDNELKKKKPMEIAELELKLGKLNNIKIKRILPNGKIEIRLLSELKFYSFY